MSAPDSDRRHDIALFRYGVIAELIQLLIRLSGEDTASLTALNRPLATWIEGEYHMSPHRGLDGATPLEQWALSGEAVRFAEPQLDLADLFLFEVTRKVQQGPHREPQRRGLRGRCRPGR